MSPAISARTAHDLRSPLLGDRGDLVVVGRDDHPVDALGGERGRDRAPDERHAADAAEVLARHALRSAARGDDGDDL